MSSAALPFERSDLIAWMLFGVWLVGTSVGLYLYPIESAQLFEPPNRPFSLSDKQRLEEWFRRTRMGPHLAPGATVVHVYRTGCDCNEFAEAEFAALMKRYETQGVRFFATDLSNATEKSVMGAPLLRGPGAPPAGAMLRTVPAVFIFAADGRLMYYGPYRDSAWCGGTGGLLVVPALDRALVGKESARPIAARGCFCT